MSQIDIPPQAENDVANPSQKVPNLTATISATSAACDTAAEAISTKGSVSNQANVDAGNAKSALAAGIASARVRLGGLRDELGQLLDDDDERWHAFGFNKPSDPETPEVPENVVVTPGAPGSHLLFIDWDDARRAVSYRVIIIALLGGAELKNEIVHEASEVTFTDLPPGQVKITITARNSNGGESAASDPVTATVP